MRRILITLLSVLVCMGAGAAPLHILLTNDDGYDTPGIQALHSALQSRGHRVTLAAPSRNASGQSAAINFENIQAREVSPGVYSVDGTPATCVVLAVTGILGGDRPDLVISGINEGANLGILSSFSGTVGATVAALYLLQPGIPGIAISTDLLDEEPASAMNRAHNATIAEFMVRVVDALQRNREAEQPLLPAGLALNINYPPLGRDTIKGIGIYTHGRKNPFQLNFEASGAGQWKPKVEQRAIQTDRDTRYDDDVHAFAQGYITIVPINGDYAAQPDKPSANLPALRQLAP